MHFPPGGEVSNVLAGWLHGYIKSFQNVVLKAGAIESFCGRIERAKLTGPSAKEHIRNLKAQHAKPEEVLESAPAEAAVEAPEIPVLDHYIEDPKERAQVITAAA